MTPKMPYRDEKIILKIVENRNFCNKESISLTKNCPFLNLKHLPFYMVFSTFATYKKCQLFKYSSMKLASKYNPTDIEAKWYQYWLDNKLFSSKPDGREPYTIVIPPPNVTGVLHMGHMLNNTIQDILVRRARMTGKNACWVPGTDHASIATEAQVVNRLAEQGIKTDLTRRVSKTRGIGQTNMAALF